MGEMEDVRDSLSLVSSDIPPPPQWALGRVWSPIGLFACCYNAQIMGDFECTCTHTHIYIYRYCRAVHEPSLMFAQKEKYRGIFYDVLCIICQGKGRQAGWAVRLFFLPLFNSCAFAARPGKTKFMKNTHSLNQDDL